MHENAHKLVPVGVKVAIVTSVTNLGTWPGIALGKGLEDSEDLLVDLGTTLVQSQTVSIPLQVDSVLHLLGIRHQGKMQAILVLEAAASMAATTEA